MGTITKYLAIGLIKVVTLIIACFYGFFIGLRLLYYRCTQGSKYFSVKEGTLPPPCLQDSAFKHSYVQLNNIKLHCVEAGDRSKPLMLFLHGFPEFWFSWRHQLKYFAEDYWVVAFDMRGYGDSEKPKDIANYSVDHLVGDVVGLVKSLGKEKCILVGHDWGGFIAWYMFFFQLPYLPELFGMANDLEIYARLFSTPPGGLLCNSTNSKQHIPSEYVEAYKYTFSRLEKWTAPINYYRALLSATVVYNQDVFKLPKIEQPTLIIWGDADPFLVTALAKDSIQYCTGKTEVKIISNGSHFIQIEQQEKVNDAMQKFLAKRK